MGFGWIGVACALCVGLCVLLMASPIRVEVEYWRAGSDELRAQVRAMYGLVRLRWRWASEAPPVRGRSRRSREKSRKSGDERRGTRSIGAWRRFAHRALRALDRMAPHVHVDELRLEARMGAGESVRTGMLVGASYAAIYTLLGWLSSRVRMHRVPTVSIAPAFQEALLTIYAKSIVRIRTGYVIAAGLRLLTAWKRRAS
ncbi:DUF2953 domain-containing protein [Alicyclobacillus mali (ex Roth et al. 2021)]|uniref:DUF2953 domain-containing protein n=1 Tax=Alicyclobacillus mali (ex Roth et al. 2021) TaxID=1123961 RepID=UPI00083590BB|nr:DUF2953 domain-containing protein [Alicyclobacillus mali (ex Roth et al. 2021)]